jgi:hypothetical protein
MKITVNMSLLPVALALLLLLGAGAQAQDDSVEDLTTSHPEYKSPPPPYPKYTRKPKPSYGCKKPGDWDQKGLKELKTCPAKEVILNPECVKVECGEYGWAKVSIKNCIPKYNHDRVKAISICYKDNCYLKKNVKAGDYFFKFRAKCNSSFTLAFFDEDYKGSYDTYSAIRKSGCSGHYNDKQLCKACGLYEYKIPCPPVICKDNEKYPCIKNVDDGYCGCKKVKKPNGTLCRPKYGECDEEEKCYDGKCPEDKFKVDLYHPCRPSQHPCDAAEFCDGTSRYCPKDKCVAKYDDPKDDGPKHDDPKHDDPKHDGPKDDGPKHD